MKKNPTRKLTRLQFGKLLGYAWGKSANVEIGMSGFRATGIAPFNPGAIPDYAYIAIELEQGVETVSHGHGSNSTPEKQSSPQPCSTQARATNTPSAHSSTRPHSTQARATDTPSAQPGCSHWPDISTSKDDSTVEHDPIIEDDATPGKLLDDISPIPKTSAAAVVKKRGRQIATILYSSERILMQKNKELKKKQTRPTIQKKTVKKQRIQLEESSDSGSESPVLQESAVSVEEWNENKCVGCGEDYFNTSSTEEWVKCIRCSRWFYEGCSQYNDLCDFCGKSKKTSLK